MYLCKFIILFLSQTQCIHFTARKSFEALKSAFTSTPILTHWIPDKPIIVETNASDYALGVILSIQTDSGEVHPVAFHSRTFTVMSFVCSKREQTNNTKCSTAMKRLYFWQRQRSRREPALMLKLDYTRERIYAEELSPWSRARSTCRGFLANAKAKRDESRTASET